MTSYLPGLVILVLFGAVVSLLVLVERIFAMRKRKP